MRFASILIILLVCSINLKGQKDLDPLNILDFYIGDWVPPSSEAWVQRNPLMKDFHVISLNWGANRKVLWSKTGIYSSKTDTTMSEGMITYNPYDKKVVWREYQIDNELLFDGEYKLLDNGSLQRIYTVYYAENYPDIPNPQEPGWTRLYRETFTPTGPDSIDWLTETFIGGKWIRSRQGGGDAKAVRRK